MKHLLKLYSFESVHSTPDEEALANWLADWFKEHNVKVRRVGNNFMKLDKPCVPILSAHLDQVKTNGKAEHFVLTWIVGCYYLSLENIKEVEDCLYYDPTALSFGSFLAQLKSPEGQEMKQLGKYKWYYVGNFFWINSKKLKNYNDRNKVIPPLLGDRYYAENILANLFPLNIQGQATFAGSKNFSYYIKYDDSFLNICDLISVVYKNDSDAIYSMVNEVTEEINKQLA